MWKLILSLLTSCILLLSWPAYSANVSRHDETTSGLRGWRVRDQSILIELNPLLRDQVRAFYLGRGFSEQIGERIAAACVYQVEIRNVSDVRSDIHLEVNLSDWKIHNEQGTVPLVSKQTWIRQWMEANASNASVLAFKWATFPGLQNFQLTGDYGWGMILFGIQTAKTFDVQLSWRANGMRVEQLVTGLSCPS